MNDAVLVPGLQTANELPADFREGIGALNLVPAWTQLRATMAVDLPRQSAVSTIWRYRDVRPLLVRSGDLVTSERSERRVLGLMNPGVTSGGMATMPSIFFGLQMLLPGERAPNHKHLAAAARIFIEGDDAYTTVNGERFPMSPGDVILTPPRTWHDHGNDGVNPAIWMDVLDVPLSVPMDLSYVVMGNLSEGHSNTPDSAETLFRCAGTIPYSRPGRPPPEYPLCRFRWSRVREALDAIGQHCKVPAHLAYVNPTTGRSALKTLGFSARLLRAGETVAPERSSANQIFFALDGACEVTINGESHCLDVSDTLTAPTHSTIYLRNLSAFKNSYLIQVDDVPLQSSLGLYDELDYQ